MLNLLMRGLNGFLQLDFATAAYRRDTRPVTVRRTYAAYARTNVMQLSFTEKTRPPTQSGEAIDSKCTSMCHAMEGGVSLFS